MDDPADVGLVDAHAEGDRRAHDPRVVAQELVLVAGPFLAVESRVIGARGKSPAGQRLGHAFRRGPARTINDAALGLALADEIDDLLQRLVLRHDAVGEVRAVEARYEDLRLA